MRSLRVAASQITDRESYGYCPERDSAVKQYATLNPRVFFCTACQLGHVDDEAPKSGCPACGRPDGFGHTHSCRFVN
jgi:rubrerythrin